MANSYPIPRLLWESIDAILYNKGLQLARDIAKELEVDSTPLIKLLKAQESGKFTILPDEDEAAFLCQAIYKVGEVYIRCRCGTASGRFCNKHERDTVDIPKGALMARKIITPTDIFYEVDKKLYDTHGKRVGILKNGDKVILFEEEA